MSAKNIITGSWPASTVVTNTVAHGITVPGGATIALANTIVALLAGTTANMAQNGVPDATNANFSRTDTASGSVRALVELGVRGAG